ncbi:hypothetical protein GC163_05375 [bacterium]|nr:hypothetical protein [bacterium]
MAIETWTATAPTSIRESDPAEEVRQLVEMRTGGRIQELQVAVEGQRLIISGRTGTYYSKQLATHAALDVTQQLVIQNDVIVGI